MAAQLTEGKAYLIKATTTNMSTKAGVPVAAPLTVNIAATVNSQVIMEDSEVYGFAAEETHAFEFSMTVPGGTGGKVGAVVAEVLDPKGNKLADGSLDVVIMSLLPSDLLIAYQDKLEDAIRICESDDPNRWVNIPGYGLQYACPAINQLKELMTAEAINIGMISSAEEAYFVRDVMYYSDGTTIVPYWWPCPYCPERFRSPEAREAHISEVHGDILNTKATIVKGYARPDPKYGPVASIGVYILWRNDSPFPITGRLAACKTDVWGSCMIDLHYVDVQVGSGQQVAIYLPYTFAGEENFKATLTLVGAPLPGMFLDEMLFRAGEEPEL